jgi:TatD DNase family protein
MYSDSHCHLDSFTEQQRAWLLEEAARDEIVLMLTTGLDLETSQASVRIAEEHSFIYAGIGYHPSEAIPIDDDIYGQLAGLAMSEKVVVVSEVGLDFAWQDAPPREIQEACFRRNVQLAKELSLPLQLHIGNAHRQAFRILAEEDAFRLGGAIHEQIANEADLELWLGKGYYITVGLRVLRSDANWQELARVVERIPIERLLLETDAYGGGGQNEPIGPSRVKLVAQKVAEIRGISPEDLGRITTENLRRFLKINT